MTLFNPAVFFIAWRYIKGSKKQRFASFVAILATLGIAIGVCALIVVSSIMQGLQNRLKANILNDCAHVVVQATVQDIPQLLALDHVNALVPFVQGEAMLQYGSDIVMVTLQGTDYNSLYVSNDYASSMGLTTRDRMRFLREDASRQVNEQQVQSSREQVQAAVHQGLTDGAHDHSAAAATAAQQAAAPNANRFAAEFSQVASEVSGSEAESLPLTAEFADETIGEDAAVADQQLLFCIPMPHVDRSGYNYGSIFAFAPNSYDIALNYQLLLQLGVDTLSETKVRLVSTQNARYTPFGLIPVQRNFKVAAIINAIDRSAAPTVIGNYTDVYRFLRLSPDATYFRLYLSDPFLVEEVVSKLEGKFAYSDWRERYGDFFKAVSLEKITMSLMLCLIVVVAAFNILSSLTMVVSSRVNEIAILKTIGMSNRALLSVFLLVGMSASLIGSCLGIISGIPLALNAQSILSALGISIVQGDLPIEIASGNIILIVVLCLAVSLLCTFYPAYYASKADPASNLVHA